MKIAASSRERRFTCLIIYSHGKTHRLSFSLTTLTAVLVLVGLSLVAFGAFVNSYIKTSRENQELHYLYDVAGIQQMQIHYLQERLKEMAERVGQIELSESQTRSMLLKEGLIDESVSEMAAVASRRAIAETTSRSGRNVSRIPLWDMGSALYALEQAAYELDGEIAALEQRLDDLRKKAEQAVAYSRARPSIWPVQGNITSSYGQRRHPVSGRQDFHEGIDIGAPYRAPIRATADGTVIFAGYQAGYGWCVRIRHGYGFQTVYAHCSSIAVKNGQEVKRGDVIAYVGSSGASTGPHLHYEVYKDGQHQDPTDYLPK